jgi:hypothetical protein
MSQVKAVLRTNAFNNMVMKRLLNQSANSTPQAPKAPENVLSRVQGLTERCVKKSSGPVGPGKKKKIKISQLSQTLLWCNFWLFPKLTKQSTIVGNIQNLQFMSQVTKSTTDKVIYD